MFVWAGRRTALFFVVALAIGCGSGKSGHGGAGASGATGAPGSAGASGSAGAAGTSGAAGSSGAASGAGASATSGTSGASGSAGAGAAAGTGDGGLDGRLALTDGGGDSACGAFHLDRLAPDLLLLLDRSGSMANQLDGTRCPAASVACETRWGDCTTAVNQVVQQTEGSLRWGLEYFPNNALCGVTDVVAVPVGANNATAIAASIAITAPGGSTPTHLAVASAAAYLAALPDPNPKLLLLATDGLPNCAPGATDTAVDDTPGTIAAVKAAADSGIPVYVIGIGQDVMNQQNLEQIAIAGGRPRAGTPAFYPVESSGDLAGALSAIGSQSTPCAYALPGVPPDPTNVAVVALARKIPRDPTHAEGWDYDTTFESVQLYGTWCTDDQRGRLGDVTAMIGCAPGLAP